MEDEQEAASIVVKSLSEIGGARGTHEGFGDKAARLEISAVI